MVDILYRHWNELPCFRLHFEPIFVHKTTDSYIARICHLCVSRTSGPEERSAKTNLRISTGQGSKPLIYKIDMSLLCISAMF